MSLMLLDCPTDGLVAMESWAGIDGVGARLEVSGSRSTCPKCERQVPIVDAVYHGDQTVEFHLTESQRVRLVELVEWVQRAQDQAMSKEGVNQGADVKLQRAAPGIRSVLTWITSGKGVAVSGWAALIVAVVSLVLANQSARLSIDEIQQLWEVYQQSEQIQRDMPPERSPLFPTPTVEDPPTGVVNP